MSNLRHRVWTAAAALAIVLPILFVPPLMGMTWGAVVGVQILCVAAVGLGMWEFGALREPPGSPTNRLFAGGLGALPVLAAPYGTALWLASLACAALAVPAAAVLRPGEDENLKGARDKVSATLFGVIYLGFLISFIPALRTVGVPENRPYLGLHWMIVVLAAVWLGDSGAYFVGRQWGRNKLAPRISPAKTWEGAGGGLLTSMAAGAAVALVLQLAFGMSFPLGHAMVAGGLAGAFGQVGDLAESMIKRGAGVKDSGTLFPGHGGMLDRLDSLLFAFPAVYFYAMYGVGA